MSTATGDAPFPGARPAPDGARGARWLQPIDTLLQRLDELVGRAVPPAVNPLLASGALATTTLLIATGTGVLLLFWYSPSVHLAHESVTAMQAAPWTAGLVRSLHRYSSDAAMFFTIVHALKLFFARRFSGARWLAWVTGVVLVGILWFVGWTGYWLVWDQRAQQVALGSARLLDSIPIFIDPLSRSFLTDEGVNSLIFFLVFFIHMLVPLAMALALWLHVARLSRPQWITRTALSVWAGASLVVLAIAFPATAADPARMALQPGHFTLDAWFLAPLALTDRLGAGALWSLLLFSGVALASVPWTLGRRRAAPAEVDTPKCNACGQCFTDCPYDAITLVDRTDDRPFPAQAAVIAERCVSCGICAGSCDSVGIGLADMWVSDERRRIESWLAEADPAEGEPVLVLGCAHSAAADLAVDERTGRAADLPGARVLKVPCAGWVHPLTVERALRRGASHALVVACGPGECAFREGSRWIEERLAAERSPALRHDKVDASRARVVELSPGRGRALRAAIEALRGGEASSGSRGRGAWRAVAGLGIAALLAVVVLAGSDVGYAGPPARGPTLVVSFKHPGQVGESCRDLTPEEQAALPPHMRRTQDCSRVRSPVRVEVAVDGEVVHAASHAPRGIWNDGNSIALDRIPLTAGSHRVRIALGDTPTAGELNHVDERVLEFREGEQRVVLFDRALGFTWH